MTIAADGRIRVRWTLLAFIVVVVGMGFLIGFVIRPDDWYRSLAKPSFNPPDWIFGPVWAVVYLLIAIAGWRTWMRESKSAALSLWVAQLAVNYSWTPVFFGLHATGYALSVILVLLCLILAFIVNHLREDPTSALLFLPYACWVVFASVLNAAIYWLNS
ncbi:tryptophan-rich sensory protein [Bradyrhizobium jicamae]|uniref:Tryptophan-rich sensory protein n=1 Tax=Bradyrhizobium jicamae TaxID=280332 RepID=A0ABS5FYE0_9BRAD|nr:TspO/MBR family protein [Bradyrhizobium jicamae]MBR0801788.1 tryptophan-rich sensory protein [Bradyrhizobium jicamae]MBR0938974.1 tryptophan-rich sensory protein [Bradyrhizobium jicamae]